MLQILGESLLIASRMGAPTSTRRDDETPSLPLPTREVEDRTYRRGWLGWSGTR